MANQHEVAVFGAGCFWCVEAVFQRLKGVVKVEPGYTGGHTDHPTYQAVCRGDTGHAEVCRIDFDPAVISYEALLDVFFHTHDPTTLNRQGADRGTQYRSVIYYVNDAQKKAAETMRAALESSAEFPDPIVTEIAPLGPYFTAEDYHHNYFNTNPDQGYCSVVIGPKLAKFAARYRQLIAP